MRTRILRESVRVIDLVQPTKTAILVEVPVMSVLAVPIGRTAFACSDIGRFVADGACVSPIVVIVPVVRIAHVPDIHVVSVLGCEFNGHVTRLRTALVHVTFILVSTHDDFGLLVIGTPDPFARSKIHCS